MNAAYNYWGDQSGPYHPIDNPNASGDNISNNVDFSNWLESDGAGIFWGLTGSVRDTDGMRLSDVFIEIQCGNLYYAMFSAGEVFYEVYDLPMNDCQWNICASKDGYFSFNTERNINNISYLDITLEERRDLGESNVTFERVHLSTNEARVNELIYLNVTLRNNGNGTGRFIKIQYFINNQSQYYQMVETLYPGEDSVVNFIFSGDRSQKYQLSFEIIDDGSIVDRTEYSNVYIDQISSYPTVVITGPQDNIFVNGTIIISGTAYDNNDEIHIVEYMILRKNDSHWQPVNGTNSWQLLVNTTTLEDGEYSFAFRSYDGRWHSNVKIITLNVKNEKDYDESYSIFRIEYVILVVIVMILFILYHQVRKGK